MTPSAVSRGESETLATEFFQTLADQSKNLHRRASNETVELVVALEQFLQRQEAERLSEHRGWALANPFAYAAAASDVTTLAAQLVNSCETPGGVRAVANWMSLAANEVLARIREPDSDTALSSSRWQLPDPAPSLTLGASFFEVG